MILNDDYSKLTEEGFSLRSIDNVNALETVIAPLFCCNNRNHSTLLITGRYTQMVSNFQAYILSCGIHKRQQTFSLVLYF